MKRFTSVLCLSVLFTLFTACGESSVDTGITPDVTESDTSTDTGTDMATPGPDIVKNDAGKDTGKTDTGKDSLECKKDIDCNDNDVCTTDTCHWGECFHSVHECGDGKTCYESAEGNLACAYVCATDDECGAHNQNECVKTFCVGGFCQFELDNGKECNDNDSCTVDDTCEGGVCNGTSKNCPNGCQNGECIESDDITCQFTCPESVIQWTKVVLWYGNDQSTEVACGGSFTFTQNELCLWGTEMPTFKINLTDGEWEWGGGINTTVTCNFPATLSPDPTPSIENPDVTLGDMGVALVTFQGLTCCEGDGCVVPDCQNDNDCPAANNPCTKPVCQDGTCGYVNNNGQACNDEDPCTENDTCEGGICGGMLKNCPNGCMGGLCVPECQNDQHCQDSDPCTDNTCVFGTCQSLVKLNCCSDQTNTCTNDNNSCTAMICNPDNTCGFVADNNATCTAGGLPGHCEASSCWNDTPQGFCDDSNTCTDDATENGVCVHGTVCADGNPCTQDSCLPNGDEHTCVFAVIAGCCLTSADCNDQNNCTKDSCSGATCQHENKCLGGEPQMYQCATDADCVNTGFGDYCLESGDPSLPVLKLCQPCYNGGPNGNEMIGCEAGNVCLWGVGGTAGILYSVYWCEAVVCQTNEDCDDGNACTTDVCGMGIDCSNTGIPGCELCQTNDECVEAWWCDEKSGGAIHRTGNCTSGACEKTFHVDSETSIAHNCHVPIPCEQDINCPGTGECLINLCYFSAGWPQCATDADCGGTGTCQFNLGTCAEYACYTVNDPVTGLSKDCAVGFACVDNTCMAIESLTCQTDADCTGDAFGGVQYYCEADLVTADKHCYPCSQDYDAAQINEGCGQNVPYCVWNNSTHTFACQECYNDLQCTFGTECTSGFCEPIDGIVCQFDCPVSEPSWLKAVVWYDSNASTEVACGGTLILSHAGMCDWGLGFEAFSFNLTDGQWLWNDGVNTTVTCNYPATIIPDPTPSGTQGVTLGDLGVALVTFPTLTCN